MVRRRQTSRRSKPVARRKTTRSKSRSQKKKVSRKTSRRKTSRRKTSSRKTKSVQTTPQDGEVTGYIIFAREFRQKSNLQGVEFFKALAQAWRGISAKERQKYEQKAKKLAK